MSVDNNTNNEVDNTNNDAGNDANHVLLEDAKNAHNQRPANDIAGNTPSMGNASLYNDNASLYNTPSRANGNAPTHTQHDTSNNAIGRINNEHVMPTDGNAPKNQPTVQEYLASNYANHHANHHTHDGLNDRQVADGQASIDEQQANPSFDLIATEQSSDVADVIANTQKSHCLVKMP